LPTHRQRCAHHGMWTHLIKCVHPVANVQKALNPGMAQNKCNCRVTAKIPKVIRSVFGKVTTIEQHQCFPARYELGMCRARLVWNGYSVYMYLRRPCSSCGISSMTMTIKKGWCTSVQSTWVVAAHPLSLQKL